MFKMRRLQELNWNLGRFKKDPEKQFFLLSGCWFFFLVLGGFADSFYFSNSLTPTPVYLKVHGISYSLWVLLYLIQSGLVSTGNTRIHMMLGKITLVVLLVLLVSGYYTILYKASQGSKSILQSGRNLLEIGTGIALVLLAYLKRRDFYYHKRLMLVGMTFLTIAAIPRIILGFWNLELGPFKYYGFFLAPLLALVIFDTLYFGKIKWFSLTLLAGTFSISFFRPYRLLFDSAYGEKVIELLSRIFLWY